MIQGKSAAIIRLTLKMQMNEMPAFKFKHEDDTIRQDSLNILKLGKNLLLKGPTGAGKTRLADDLAAGIGRKMVSINCSVDTDMEALLGFKTVEYRDGKQEIIFVDGPVVRAMKNGWILYIDEINMAKPEVLPILNAALDYRRTMTNPLTGEEIIADEDFLVIAAINIGYAGTMPMNEALLNRFNIVEIDYVSDDALLEILKNQSLQSDEDVLRKLTGFHKDLVTMTRQGQISKESSSVRSLLDLSDLSTLIPPVRALERAVTGKLDNDQEKTAIYNAFKLHFE